MDVRIKNDGAGYDIGMHVDGNSQAHNFSIVRQLSQDAVSKGNAYNVNTGWISLTNTGTANAVLYFKNDEAPLNGESTIIIDSIIIGITNAGTNTSTSKIVIIENPTAGTIVSGASAVASKRNRNFGSSNTLAATTLAYKGAEGNTITDGTTWGHIGQQAGSRGVYPLDIELPKGKAIGITMDTLTTAGTTEVYVALIISRVDGNNK